jgi:hypothetical protein
MNEPFVGESKNYGKGWIRLYNEPNRAQRRAEMKRMTRHQLVIMQEDGSYTKSLKREGNGAFGGGK